MPTAKKIKLKVLKPIVVGAGLSIKYSIIPKGIPVKVIANWITGFLIVNPISAAVKPSSHTTVIAATSIGTPAIRYQTYEGKYCRGIERLKTLINGAIERQRKTFDAWLFFFHRADRQSRETRSIEWMRSPKERLKKDVIASATTIKVM